MLTPETSNCISMRMSNNNRINCSYPERNATSYKRQIHMMEDKTIEQNLQNTTNFNISTVLEYMNTLVFEQMRLKIASLTENTTVLRHKKI